MFAIIQLTPDNSNLMLSQTKIDFPWIFFHTFIAVLPTVTRTHDNSNLLLTRSYFLFPFRSVLCNLTLDNSFEPLFNLSHCKIVTSWKLKTVY